MTKQQMNMLLAMYEGFKYVRMSLNCDQVFVSNRKGEMYDYNPCENVNDAWPLIVSHEIFLNHEARLRGSLLDAMSRLVTYVIKCKHLEIPTHTSVKLVRGKYVPCPTEGYSRDIEPNEFEV